MFLRCQRRKKDGKTHEYWSIVESRRVGDGRVAQRQVLYLGEIFDHKPMAPLTRAIAIPEPLDKKYPDHPRITHYMIRSYDFAPIAQRGIPAAGKYAVQELICACGWRRGSVWNQLPDRRGRHFGGAG